jgi:hypothetical protein
MTTPRRSFLASIAALLTLPFTGKVGAASRVASQPRPMARLMPNSFVATAGEDIRDCTAVYVDCHGQVRTLPRLTITSQMCGVSRDSCRCGEECVVIQRGYTEIRMY